MTTLKKNFASPKLKVIIITSNCYPATDAVGAYTWHFAREMARTHQVTIVTAWEKGTKKIHEVPSIRGKVFKVIKNWKNRDLQEIYEIIASTVPDKILIQYHPFLYAPRGGINLSFCYFVNQLGTKTAIPIALMCHELHYPLQAHPKAMIMFTLHIVMLIILVKTASYTFASTYYMAQRIKKIMPFKIKNIYPMPVSSNIEYQPQNQSAIRQKKKDLGLEGYWVIGCFGGFHPSKNYRLLFKILNHFIRDHPHQKIKILFIGASKEEIISHCPDCPYFHSFLVASGYLNDDEVSTYLSCMDIFAGYFNDGLSTRRSSVMAALAHGIPIISTKTFRTDLVFLNQPFLHLLPATKKEFSNILPIIIKRLLKEKRPDPTAIRSYYQQHFSPQKGVAFFLDTFRAES